MRRVWVCFALLYGAMAFATLVCGRVGTSHLTECQALVAGWRYWIVAAGLVAMSVYAWRKA